MARTIGRSSAIDTSGKPGVSGPRTRNLLPTLFGGARPAAFVLVLLVGAVLFGWPPMAANSQEAVAQSAEVPADGNAADAKQPATTRTLLRFLTDSDYPPFNYLDEEGNLTGFNVDVARAICLELDVTCDVKSLAWPDLLPALGRGEVDAVIASHAITSRTLAEADFTDRYYFTPARFAALSSAKPLDISPIGLEGAKIGVLAGSAHEAYLNQFFRDSLITAFTSLTEAQAGLVGGEIDLLFHDGIALVFWMNGSASGNCCELRGGPFFDDRYFGDGIGIAVRKNNIELKRQLNKALAAIRTGGRYEELLLRYFPTKIY